MSSYKISFRYLSRQKAAFTINMITLALVAVILTVLLTSGLSLSSSIDSTLTPKIGEANIVNVTQTGSSTIVTFEYKNKTDVWHITQGVKDRLTQLRDGIDMWVYLVSLVIFVASILNMVSSNAQMIERRKGDIAIIRILGGSTSFIMNRLMVERMMAAVFASVLGILGGWYTSMVIADHLVDIMPFYQCRFDPFVFALVVALTLLTPIISMGLSVGYIKRVKPTSPMM
ncbi:MAG: ABC transporter permease [archaeon]|nr:ABC transporter permease [archaeon]